MFDTFQNNLAKIIQGLFIVMLIYFFLALLGNNGITYSYALSKEVAELKKKLDEQQNKSQILKSEIILWEKYPDQMAEEYLVSNLSMKKRSARYFQYFDSY